MARLFENGATVGLDADLGKYYIDRNSDGAKGTCVTSTTDECFVDVNNQYSEGDKKGTYTTITSAEVALVKPLAKKAVTYGTLYDFGTEANFIKSVDASMAGAMRDCGECHVGGGANEYVPVAQGTTLAPGARPALRDNPAIVTTGRNAFNYFIDQYDENNNGIKGEVLPQNYADTGVLEMDCLMCHMEGYSWDDRTQAIRKGNFDASRVAGAGLGTADNAAAGSTGGTGYGKKVTYDPLMVENVGGNATLSALALNKIKDIPPSANCSSCHMDLHKVDWKKRGDTWAKDMEYATEVHGSLGCQGCHTRTDGMTMNPGLGTSDNPLWTGNAKDDASGAITLGHDPSKGNAPYSSLWNKTDGKAARTCAGCHLASAGQSYVGFGGAPDPTNRHTQLGLTQTLIQKGGMTKMTGVADGSHLDVITCEACHTKKLGHGPVSSESLYEWGTGGALVDGTGSDADGRLTDHENLYVERTMENNLAVAWDGSKIGVRNALLSMFWRDKDEVFNVRSSGTKVDVNNDGQDGAMDAVNPTHVSNAMKVAGLQVLTHDGVITGPEIAAQALAIKNYLPTVGITGTPKLKLSLMGVFFKVNHGTTPAANAWGSGGCKDCHGVNKGFYNGPYAQKPRDLNATWTNDAGTKDLTAVGGNVPNWNYVVPFTTVNMDNYSGRDVTLPLCSTYYGPNARPALPTMGTTLQIGQTCTEGGTNGTWTLYPLGSIGADYQYTDYHPSVWAKGQVGRSIAITAVMSNTNTIRTMDRSEGLWEANFVTGTYNGTITGTNKVNYTTRAAWVNYLNGLDNYNPAIHMDHASYDCSVCHSDGIAPVGGRNADYRLVSDSLLPAAEQFTFIPGTAGGLPTCTTACHLVASAPASSDVAIARISQQHSAPGQFTTATPPVEIPAENFTVNLDGSKSACYHVDATTGQTTQGTKSYTWTLDGSPTTVPDNCNATVDGVVGSATCRAHWTTPGTDNVKLAVGCTSGTGASNDTTVAVTRFDIGAAAVNNTSLTADVSGKTVTVKATTLDTEVGIVTILWADGQKSVITSTSTPSIATLKSATGVTHTYAKSGIYKAYVVTTNDGDPNDHQFTYPLTSGATVDRVTIP